MRGCALPAARRDALLRQGPPRYGQCAVSLAAGRAWPPHAHPCQAPWPLPRGPPPPTPSGCPGAALLFFLPGPASELDTHSRASTRPPTSAHLTQPAHPPLPTCLNPLTNPCPLIMVLSGRLPNHAHVFLAQVLFLAGVSLIIGPRGVVRFFFQKRKVREKRGSGRPAGKQKSTSGRSRVKRTGAVRLRPPRAQRERRHEKGGAARAARMKRPRADGAEKRKLRALEGYTNSTHKNYKRQRAQKYKTLWAE
jgi:hypothetical protein